MSMTTAAPEQSVSINNKIAGNMPQTAKAPLRYFIDEGIRQRFIIYTPKYPNLRICLPPKIPTLLAYPPKLLRY